MDAFRRRPHEPADGASTFGLAVGVLGSLVLSVVMLPLRDHLHNDNMALALVIPVLLAAVLGGRWAGVISALTAALCFDFFYTVPYQSLRISSDNDVASFVVLLVVALIAAEVGIRARRGGSTAREVRLDLDRVYRVIELAARGGDIDDVISSARAELIGLFGLIDCVFDRTSPPPPRPHLGVRGALVGAPLVASHTDFLLPAGGVDLPVVGRGHEYGRLVLYTDEPVRASLTQRLVAVAIADELGVSMASERAV